MSTALRGVIAYEFRMQVRRPVVWVVLLLSIMAVIAASHAPFQMHLTGVVPWQYAGSWALDVQTLAPAAFGCLLADRILRESRLRVDELADSLPVAPVDALLGKWLGASAATAAPIAVAFVAGAIYLAVRHGLAILPWSVAAFALVNVPGLCFVAAFSLGCPAVMPVALYQFLFVGYWFWGNFLSPAFHIPTISHTVLTPVGGYASTLFGTSGPGGAALAPLLAWSSVALLLVVAGAALAATGLVRARQRAAAGAAARIGRARAAEGAPSAEPARRSALVQRLRYEARILGPGVLGTPLLIVAVFDALALLTVVAGGRGEIVARVLTSALEIGLSLGAGIAAANLVASEPTVELHLAMVDGYRATALTRLGLAIGTTCLLGLVLTAVMAATGTLLSGVSFGFSQLVWAAPVLWMTAAGAVLALVMRSRAGSVGVVTGIWLAEFIGRELFRGRAWLKPFNLFATSFARGAPWWLTNRLELIGMAAVLFIVAWVLLGAPEAFVGTAHE